MKTTFFVILSLTSVVYCASCQMEMQYVVELLLSETVSRWDDLKQRAHILIVELFKQCMRRISKWDRLYKKEEFANHNLKVQHFYELQPQCLFFANYSYQSIKVYRFKLKTQNSDHLTYNFDHQNGRNFVLWVQPVNFVTLMANIRKKITLKL